MSYNSFRETAEVLIKDNKLDDYLEDKYINAIKIHTGYLDKLPVDKYEEVAEAILGYYLDHRDTFMYDMSKFKKYKKPINKINSDLNTVKKFKEMLHRLYPISEDNIVLKASTQREKLKGLNRECLTLLDTMIEELEDRNFSVISESNYYTEKAPTKIPLKTYLDKLTAQYKLDTFLNKIFIEAI